MRARTLHPRQSTSRFSKRVQRRRNPCNRRNTRAISLRRVDSSRADAQGLTRVRRGGPTGAYPSAAAQGRVWAPTDARSLSTAGGAGGGPRRVSNWRPAGAAGAGPGECAGERRAIVRGNPRHRGGPAASGAAEGLRTVCFRAPVPSGGTLTTGLSSDRASRLRRTISVRVADARRPGRAPRFSTSEAAGGRGGARCQSGPVTRAICRPARRQTRGQGALGDGRGDMAARHRKIGRDPGLWSLREVPTARRPESCIIMHNHAH